MLATLILGIAAGAGAPYAEPYIKTALEGVPLGDAPLTALELRSFSFAACLVAAALLAWILGGGSALALAIGAALGVAGPRLIDKVRARRVPDYDE